MQPATPQPPALFDPALRQRRLERARKHFPKHDFLHNAIALDIIDRIESINRSFTDALIIGPGSHLITQNLTPDCAIDQLFHANDPLSPIGHKNHILFDDTHLPFAHERFDLIVSMMSLHHLNDIPAALAQIRRVLRPDGVMIAALPGEETLAPLKEAFYTSEAVHSGGVSPRISPFATLKDPGGLLQRAGFALPVADLMKVPVSYKDPIKLFQDLRGVGETNILITRKKTLLRRDILAHLSKCLSRDPNGCILIPFDIVFLTGWAAHHSQQRPLKPGTAKQSLEASIKNVDISNNHSFLP